jgi:hypothetical protein
VLNGKGYENFSVANSENVSNFAPYPYRKILSMRQVKLNLIQNDEYHKVIDTWADNSSDLNVSEHIEIIIKTEVAKTWYQRRNMIVFTKHMEKTDFTCFDEHANNHRVIWNSSMFIYV